LTAEIGGYKGSIDELRTSNVLRCSGNFTRPAAPFVTDANTAGPVRSSESPFAARSR
jgi:hypothetical protein